MAYISGHFFYVFFLEWSAHYENIGFGEGQQPYKNIGVLMIRVVFLIKHRVLNKPCKKCYSSKKMIRVVFLDKALVGPLNCRSSVQFFTRVLTMALSAMCLEPCVVASRKFVEMFGFVSYCLTFGSSFVSVSMYICLCNGFRKILFDVLKLFGSSFVSSFYLYEFPTRYYMKLCRSSI